MSETLGSTVRELRRARGITQQQLAEAAGVDDTYISKIEKDRLPYPPSAETLRLIAKALAADPLELFTKAERTPPELQEFFSNPEATELLRLLTRHDLRKNDWRALNALVRERMASSGSAPGKKRR